MIYLLFWACVALVFYTYIGYGVIIWVWVAVRGHRQPPLESFYEPEVTLIVPAYNEDDILAAKIHNCLALDYPASKLRCFFITDGSTDNSAAVLADYPTIKHLHTPERGGKAMAENRAMRYVTSPYVIFTDCNTLLNPQAVREIVKHYVDPQVGAVSGEKRVLQDDSDAGAGEGLYWKYESSLKSLESTIYSLMGAAGELVSFRSELFAPLEKDTILDDFVQSMRIVAAGYQVIYEPKAYAMELPSASLREEMKRKIRIAAGGWQSMLRLTALLNPFKRPVVTFLYVSHRVLRWSLTPLLLALLLPLSFYLAGTFNSIYTMALALQVLFYLSAAAGWWAAAQGQRVQGMLLVPLYFTMMNVAVFQGFWRFLRNTQPAAWSKSKRKLSM